MCDDAKMTACEVEVIKVVTLDGADSMTTVSTLTESLQIKRRKKTQKLSRDKNVEHVAIKEAPNEKEKRQDAALSEGLQLLEYPEEVKRKVACNKSYMTHQIKRILLSRSPWG